MPFGYIFSKKYTIFGYIFGVKSGYLSAIKKPQEYAAWRRKHRLLTDQAKRKLFQFFDNIADLEKRYHQLREMPYNNECNWNERARFPYARLVVGVDRQNPDRAVEITPFLTIKYRCIGWYSGGNKEFEELCRNLLWEWYFKMLIFAKVYLQIMRWQWDCLFV